jgi:uncharacterized cupredoxin-like copper-binding protein
MKFGRFLMILLTFCLGIYTQAQESEEGEEAIKLEITLKDYGFTLAGQEKNAPIKLEAGKTYAFEFTNPDILDHEVLWGRTFMINEKGAREDYETNLFDTVEAIVEGEGWEAVAPGLIELELKAGATLDVVLTIPEGAIGEWEMGCFVAGHHEAGMHTAIIVE